MLGINYVTVDGEIIHKYPAIIPTREDITALNMSAKGDTLSLEGVTNDEKP